MLFPKGFLLVHLNIAFIFFLFTLGVDALTFPPQFHNGQYIIEFTSSNTLASRFSTDLAAKDIRHSIRKTFSHKLFNGASLELLGISNTSSSANFIEDMPGVKQIWQIRTYEIPTRESATYSSSFQVATKLQRREEMNDTFTPHIMGGVDKLHEQGVSGKGMFIGIIDTGVDYNHPALGGGFGPNFKVTTGYDLVGDAYTGFNTPVEDPDPMDCNGHGTHVSGIIGADANPYSFTGVANKAKIGMWRIFGCTGRTSNDVILQAMLMAYDAGADVISMSLGGVSGWSEDPVAVLADRITQSGVPLIAAAGNDGNLGLFESPDPAVSTQAIAVGSVNNLNLGVFIAQANFTVDSGPPVQFSYAPGKVGDFGVVTLPLYAITFNTSVKDDACSPLPDSTIDLSPYVVLIHRGSCFFDTKIANAQAKGAKYFLIYDNISGPLFSPSDSASTPPSGFVSLEQGLEFVSALQAGKTVNILFTGLTSKFVESPDPHAGGYMSTFTSWGPTDEGGIKPQVSAPGGNILSTYPIALGGYAVFSGTSMATPYIAAVVALIKQVRGRSATPDIIRSLLTTTAQPLNFSDGLDTSDLLAPVIQQGGGLVNAFEAAHTSIVSDVHSISLNDTDNFVAQHPITISNTSPYSQTCTFVHNPAALAYTFALGISQAQAFPPDISFDAARLRFTPSTSITISAKSSQVLTAHFTRPSGLDPSRVPVYSGYITISCKGGDAINIPYSGIAASMKHVQVMDTANGFPYLTQSSDPEGNPIVGFEPVFTFADMNSTYIPDSYPVALWVLSLGSRILRVDIVPEKVSKLPRVLGVQCLGPVPGTPVFQNALGLANYGYQSWNGTIEDGTLAPAGRYRFLVRALRVFGDQRKNSGYESYLTNWFTIEYV